MVVVGRKGKRMGRGGRGGGGGRRGGRGGRGGGVGGGGAGAALLLDVMRKVEGTCHADGIFEVLSTTISVCFFFVFWRLFDVTVYEEKVWVNLDTETFQ